MSKPQAGDHFEMVNPYFEITECLIDVPTRHGNIVVYRVFDDNSHTSYVVTVDDKVRHPGCDAEAVIRALGNYLIEF